MNNFDSSSSGENIEFFCSYDSDLAQIYYDCFESENTRLNFGRDNSLFLLGDASAPYYKKSKLNKMRKSELIALDEIYQLLCPYDYVEVSKAELVNELQHVTIERHYKHLVNEYSWRNIAENIAHDYYISRGFSQGDAVYIVSIYKPIDNGLRRHIDNILWYPPISMYANINGLELHTDDFIGDDLYQYNTEAISENITRLPISDYAKAWLVKALPDSPSY